MLLLVPHTHCPRPLMGQEVGPRQVRCPVLGKLLTLHPPVPTCETWNPGDCMASRSHTPAVEGSKLGCHFSQWAAYCCRCLSPVSAFGCSAVAMNP